MTKIRQRVTFETVHLGLPPVWGREAWHVQALQPGSLRGRVGVHGHHVKLGAEQRRDLRRDAAGPEVPELNGPLAASEGP